jgi:hypothetical protein
VPAARLDDPGQDEGTAVPERGGGRTVDDRQLPRTRLVHPPIVGHSGRAGEGFGADLGSGA